MRSPTSKGSAAQAAGRREGPSSRWSAVLVGRESPGGVRPALLVSTSGYPSCRGAVNTTRPRSAADGFTDECTRLISDLPAQRASGGFVHFIPIARFPTLRLGDVGQLRASALPRLTVSSDKSILTFMSSMVTSWCCETGSCRWGRATVLLRGAYRLVPGSVAGSMSRSSLARACRDRLFEIRALDVVQVLDALDRAGVAAWLAGGWGVDALLGRQTRRHHDLDIVINGNDRSEPRALTALGSLGFVTVEARAPAGTWMPLKAVLRDRGGRTIDLLPVPLHSDGTTIVLNLPAGPCALPEAFAVGHVTGRPAPCLAPTVQFTFHAGFIHTAAQRRDLALLSSRFGANSQMSGTTGT